MRGLFFFFNKRKHLPVETFTYDNENVFTLERLPLFPVLSSTQKVDRKSHRQDKGYNRSFNLSLFLLSLSPGEENLLKGTLLLERIPFIFERLLFISCYIYKTGGKEEISPEGQGNKNSL